MINQNKTENSQEIELIVGDICQRSKNASYLLANYSSKQKIEALRLIANKIRKNKDIIIASNQIDLKESKNKNLDSAMLDRLELNTSRIEAMAFAVEEIAKLKDPVGKILAKWEQPNGLKISRMSIPIGVIGIIYESRPNVTADAAALCIMSGNCAILRGGSESFESSKTIINIIHEALKESNLSTDIVQIIPTTNRSAVGYMLTNDKYIDLIIPRGGKSLCQRVKTESIVPTLLHLEGNCHSYIHQDADIQMALKVIKNAKMRRTGICGATESLVVDRKIANKFIPKITEILNEYNCQIRGDAESKSIDNRIFLASNEDWDTEYLAPIISLKIVKDINEAISFINSHSSGHTDAIITSNHLAAKEFTIKIDSAIVMHNTSTQFADGGEFGMGAEIGISTGRLHARGPVGVEQLTTYKYIVTSDGQIRS